MHVLRGLQHLLHPVRQGWVLSRVAGDRGEYCAAEGRVEGRGCSAVDRVCVGEELGQGGGQQSRHLDTAQGECRGDMQCGGRGGYSAAQASSPRTAAWARSGWATGGR